MRLSGKDLRLLAFLIVTWGLNWPVMKIGVEGFGPMTFSALCMLAGIPFVGVLARAARVQLAVPCGHRRELAVLALANMTLWAVLSNFGLELLSSGRAAILAYTMPVWAAAIGVLVYGEHPSARLWAGVLAATLGVLLLLQSEWSTMASRPAGLLLMLTAAAIWGYGTHRMRRRSAPTHILAITFWSMASTLVACAALALATERERWVEEPTALQWAAVLFDAFVIFGFSQPAWFRLATILSPVESGLSVMLIPIVGVFAGIVLLGETPAWEDWAALAAIVLAMGAVLLPGRRN